MEKLTFRDAAGNTLLFRLLKPACWDAAKTFPLVLFLHGAGERGADNEKQLVHGIPQFASKENREKYPCFLVSPQCPDNSKWVDVDWSADSHQSPKEMTEPLRLTMLLVESMLKEFSVDPKRIYVTGLSMGGYGTWELIGLRPELFAAAVPICGGGDEGIAEKIGHIPIWAFHGAKDAAVKVSRSRNMIAALEKVGAKPRYTEYPDVAHNSWNRAYEDPELFKWLFTQKRE